MKRRILSLVLVFSMLLGMMSTPAHAKEVNVDPAPTTLEKGDTYTSSSQNVSLPTPPDGLTWNGPSETYNCGLAEHTHREGRNGCYERTCGQYHKHNSSCYSSESSCGYVAHAHSSECNVTYTWVLQVGYANDNNSGYRKWWPVYWDFDEDSEITNGALVSVEVGTQNVLFSDGEVAARDTLSADTADVGQALASGFTVKLPAGYYVSTYRIVCGNHYGCAVTPPSLKEETGNTDGNYTSDLYISTSVSNFNHGAQLGYNYPTTKPGSNDGNIYSADSVNTFYPAYLLIEVKEDTQTYSVTYDWGTLSNSLDAADLPAGDTELKRGSVHTVSSPGEGEIDAAALGYEFVGWKVEGTGYGSNVMTYPDRTVAILGGDIRLVAQWAEITEFSVTYAYQGQVPAGAVPPVDAAAYRVGDTVTMAATPNAADYPGYAFTGWTSADVTMASGSAEFTMPENNVTLVGTWSKDTAQTKQLTYTVEYYFNHVKRADLTQTIIEDVWVNDSLVPVDQSKFHDETTFDPRNEWTLSNTDPHPIPASVEDGAVIKLYYTGTNTSVNLNKSASVDTAQVGDSIIYTIVVQNIGSVDLTDVEILDTPNGYGGITLLNPDMDGVTYHGRTQDAEKGIQDRFTIESLPVKGSVTIRYEYVVHSLDAGKTLTNTAHWYGPEGTMDSDSASVDVEDLYTLTVKHYAEGVIQDNMTQTYSVKRGDNWNIIVGTTTATCTYNAPVSITVADKVYAFDGAASDTLTGTISGDTTVKLHYSLDEIGTDDPESPDDVPDKYQVTVVYQAADGGSIAAGALTKEVLTILVNGEPAANGDVTATGSKAVPDSDSNFSHWTLARKDHAEHTVDELAAEFAGYTLDNVNGGDEYIFTAVFTEAPRPGLAIHKSVNLLTAEVGNELHYTIRVRNTGNVPLKSIVVYDEMQNASGSIKLTGSSQSRGAMTGAETPTYTYNSENSSFTIPELAVGATVTISYFYDVLPADAGKTISNSAVTQIPDDDTPTPIISETVDVEIKTRSLTVTKELADPNQTTAQVGDWIEWSIIVKNTGETNLTGIQLTDTLSNATGSVSVYEDPDTTTVLDLSSYTFELAAGAEKSFTAWYQVKEEDVGNRINNTVIASVPDGPSDEDTPKDPVIVEQQFTVTYEYTGTVPAGAPDVPVDTKKYNSGDTVYIKEKPSVSGYDFFGWTNEAFNTSSGSFTITGDTTLYGHFLTHADIDAEKTVYAINGDTSKKDVATEGDVIEWMIVVTNKGDQAGKFSIGEHLDGALIYDKPIGAANRTQILKSDEIELGAGKSITYYAQYEVKNSDEGTIINKVHLSTKPDDIKSDPVELVNLSVTDKKITSVTTVDDREYQAGAELKVGDVVQWTITVTNSGDADGTLNQSDLIDMLQVKNSSSYDAFAGQRVTYVSSFPVTIAAGKTADIIVTWTVPEEAFGKTIRNSAKVGTDEPIVTPDIPVEERNPDLTVTKELAQGQATTVKVGETITWTILVENTGNVSLENIKLTDTLQYADGSAVNGNAVLTPAETTFTLEPGAVKSFTAIYTTVKADAGKTINNTAVAANDDTTEEDTPNEPVSVKKQFTVTYQYESEAPTGVKYPDLPETKTYNEGDLVTVADDPVAPSGFVFTDWTTDDADVSTDGTFTITKDVLITGDFLQEAQITVSKLIYEINDAEYTDGMTVKPGDKIEWIITVVNNGGLPGEFKLYDVLPGVTVTDADGEVIAPTDKQTVAGHSSRIYYATYLVKETDKGSIVNTIHVNDKTDSSDPVKIVNLTVTDKQLTKVNGENYTVGTELKVGDVVQWTITVTNSGDAEGTLNLADLTDMLQVKNGSSYDEFADQRVTYVTSFPMTVAAGGNADIIATWTVPEAAIGKTIRNSAKVGNDEPVVTPDIPVEDRNPNLTVTKKLAQNQTATVKVGETITWTILVKNTGNVTLENIKLTDTLQYADGDAVLTPAETTFTLKPGASKSFTAVYTTVEADAGKNINNTAVADVPNGPKDEDTPDKPVVVENPGLTVEKTTTQTSVKIGETITWEIKITNTGNTKLTGIVLSDKLSGAADSTAKATLSESGPFDLEVGTSKTVTATYVVQPEDAGKEINNTAVAEVPNGPKDEDTPDDPVVVKNPGLIVTKTTSQTTATVGETITWTITIQNNGNADLTGITVNDTLTADGKVIATLSLMDKPINGTVVKPFDLVVGESIVMYATYVVSSSDAGKALINTVIVAADDGTKDDDKSEETEVTPVAPPLDPEKPNKPELNKQDHVAYIIGYPDGTVRPQNNITRAEVATIFFRLLTEESRAYYWSQTNEYTDVKLTDWYNNAISTLAKADIITGYPAGTFRPNAPITRAEFATIAARFSEVIYNGGNKFTDVPTNHWAARYIALAEHLGWINGYPDGSFKPDQDITRAESMTLINRVLERAVEEEHMLSDMVKWVDNLPRHWFYEAVQEATNSHTYVRLDKRVPDQDFNYEDWIAIMPVPDWAALEKAWSTANSKG